MPTSMQLGYTVYVTADLFHTETYFLPELLPNRKSVL